MEATKKKALVWKIASCLVVALVAAGTAFVPVVANIEQGSGFMSVLFLGFLGAIIAVQVIPGLILFGMMVKGVCSLMRKEAPVKVESDD
jgi:hypothetical protein